MSTVGWTDSIGAATLGNAFIYPGNRLANWNPKNVPFGVRSNTLETGELNVTAFRDDLTVAFDIEGIPNTDMAKMLRLQMHLKRGGSVTLDTSPDTTIPTFGVCTLAPGADVQIQLTDKRTLEYTFSTVLRGRNVSGPPVGGSDGGDACTPDLPSDDDVIPFDYRAPHKDALYVRTFDELPAGTVEDSEAALRASLRNGLVGDYWYQEGIDEDDHLSDEAPLFNCTRRSLKIVNHGHTPATFLSAQSQVGAYERMYVKVWFYLPAALAVDDDPPIGNIVDQPEIEDASFRYHITDFDSLNAESFEMQGQYAAYPFDDLKDRWVSVLMLVESGSGDARAILWGPEGGDPLITVTGEFFNPAEYFNMLLQLSAFPADSGTQAFFCPQFEFESGGTLASPINPFSGINIP